MTLSKEDLEKSIQICLKENLSNVLANNLANNTKQNKRQTSKAVAAVLAYNDCFATLTSNEYFEKDLRDKLLDIEEQIFAGFLGSLKVNDRHKWKDALAASGISKSSTNDYDAQCDFLIWGDTKTPANEFTLLNYMNTHVADSSLNTEQQKHLITVNKLAKALLKIEQAVEKRFLRAPLGECQNTPSKKRSKPASVSINNHGTDNQHHQENETAEAKYPILFNWEKSLSHCTSYSQVFVHLQTLDESIAWSKSAMNARCRLCRKKGDAEKMLLCDKCDRGHHIFCLRPALKQIPHGEWFCPECKPRDVERAPRKIRESFGNGEQLNLDNNNTTSESNNVTSESDNTNDAKSDTSIQKKYSNKTKAKKRDQIDLFNDQSSDEDEDEVDEEEAEDDEDNEEVDEDDENELEEDEDELQENEDDNQSDTGNSTTNDDTYLSNEETSRKQSNPKNKIKINGFGKKSTKRNSKKFNSEDECSANDNLDNENDNEYEEYADNIKKTRKRKLTTENEKSLTRTSTKSLKTSKDDKISSKNNTSSNGTSRNSRGKRPVYNELSENEFSDDDMKSNSNKRVKGNKGFFYLFFYVSSINLINLFY